MSLSVSVPRELTRQQAGVAEDLEVIVHPKLAEAVKGVHGLSMTGSPRFLASLYGMLVCAVTQAISHFLHPMHLSGLA